MTSLFDLAKAASEKAHAPYSKFKVGAAVHTQAGHIYTGCNVENASYSLTCCAERTAIFKAVTEEGSAMRLLAVAVHTPNGGAPCGACRQVMFEFATKQTTIVWGASKVTCEMTMEELFPSGFCLSADCA